MTRTRRPTEVAAVGLLVTLATLACGPPRTEPKTTPKPIARPAPAPTFTVARPDPLAPALRLPDVVVPLSYRARLSLDATHLSGTIEIVVIVHTATDVLWMHGENLKISRAEAVSADDVATQLEPRVVKRSDAPSQFLALLAPTPLAEGHYTLRITYVAPVADRGHVDAEIGDWYSDGPRAEGVFREVAEGRAYTFTMFEPMAARKAFPCFDEPSFKVPWQLTLDVPAADIALSNTAVIAETALPDGRRRFEFAPTSPLPSYLIAFAVGPFDLVDAGASVHGVPIRIAVRKGRAADASWAVKVTAHILDLVDLEVGIPMPYPKMDLVAVPVTGKGWGAMENPGLITVRESIVRADGTGGSSRGSYVAVIAHEIAHQWFGNYVTPAWWDDIWLNESFASWLGPKIERDVEATWSAELAMPGPPPQRPPPPKGWKGWDWETPHRIGARPPLAKTNSYTELAPYFNGERGVPVIEMLEHLLGEIGFHTALTSYLTTHAHGTVTTSDLGQAVGAEAKLTLDRVLVEYLDNSTRSSVTITVDCTRAASPTLVVAQLGTAPDPVPVCVAYGTAKSRTDTCFVLESTRHELPTKGCPQWLLPNPRQLPYTSPIDNPDAVLQHGWRHLTFEERSRLGMDLDETHRLSVALRLLEDSEPRAVAMAAVQLKTVLRYLPDALRARFQARLRGVLATRPPRSHFADALAMPRVDLAGTAGLLTLWTFASEPSVLQEARALFPRWAEMPSSQLSDAVLWATMHSDPVVAGRALDQVIGGTMPVYRLTSALAESPYIREMLETRGSAAARLRDSALYELLTGRCEPSQREATARLATALRPKEVSSVLLSFDACAKKRATLEPVFRAWIDSKP